MVIGFQCPFLSYSACDHRSDISGE